MTVKFYLFVGDKRQVNEQARWPGPNPVDNLATKVERLTSHQLPLSASYEGLAALTRVGAKQIISAKAALKGYLFYPWRQQLTTPEWAPENHCRGRWLWVTELNDLIEHYSISHWCLLAKREWLGEKTNIPVGDTVAGSELPDFIHGKLPHYPLMLARVDSFGETFNEAERFFIVPESWRGSP